MTTPAPETITSWKLSLPCTKIEADRLAMDDTPLDIDPLPVLLTSEPDPKRPDDWQLDAYFEQEPSADDIALIRALIPSCGDIPAHIEALGNEDWLTLSQAGLEPIRAGRFFVYTPAHAGDVPADAISFEIEASRAFGTGHHETTTGCLVMLDRMKNEGLSFQTIADIGTGTGLLAFGASRLWPDASVLASDIDPISIEVTQDNARINGFAEDSITLVVADGMEDATIQAFAPYDLLIANILAGPLMAMAPEIVAATAKSGVIILAGLLNTQADAVIDAYAMQGAALADRYDNDDWSILRLIKA